jgi:hypothetical protein
MGISMLPNNQEDREAFLRSRNATMMLRVVKEAQTKSVEMVLDYARESGIDVTLVSTD